MFTFIVVVFFLYETCEAGCTLIIVLVCLFKNALKCVIQLPIINHPLNQLIINEMNRAQKQLLRDVAATLLILNDIYEYYYFPVKESPDDFNL